MNLKVLTQEEAIASMRWEYSKKYDLKQESQSFTAYQKIRETRESHLDWLLENDPNFTWDKYLKLLLLPGDSRLALNRMRLCS